MLIDIGDLIVYESFDKRTGIVVEEDRGYVTIQWNNGPKSVIYHQSIIKDTCHTIIKPMD